LGLRSDVPRALVVGEIVRTVHQARDPRSPVFLALTAYFATPPEGGDEQVPIPLPAGVWRERILGRDVSERELLGAILTDRRAALLCHGLLGLDRETLAFVGNSPALLRRLYEHDAAPFAGFAHVLHVRAGALELPGGPDALPIWDALIGAPSVDPAAAIPALLTRDNARLAYFIESLGTLDPSHLALVFPPHLAVVFPPHLAVVFPPKITHDARTATVRLIYRGFVTVDAQRDLADLPFQRVAYDPGALLAALPLDPDGALDGTARYWQALIQGDEVPSDGPDAWSKLHESPPATLALLLDRIAEQSLPGRRDLLASVLFTSRLRRRIPDATPADRVLLAHAFRRYPALLLTLERIGVADLGLWHAMVQQARMLDSRTGMDADRPLALLQAPIALVDRAVLAGVVDVATASGLLTRLATIDPTAPGIGRAVGQWMEGDLLPALAGKPTVADGDAEGVLLESMAGIVPGQAPAAAARVQWEDLVYRVDAAAAELARLREVRNRQGGNTLDLALALTRAGTTLARATDRAAIQSAHDVLAHARTQLEPLDTDDRPVVAAAPSVTRLVDQAVSDAARASARGDRTARAIASRLSRAEDEMLADVLTSIVYALWIGDPDGQVLLGGNVAKRHDFGRGPSMSEEERRLRWLVPAEASGAGDPWHVRGSLLALDLALGRLALRRTSIDLPAQQPRLNEGDRRVFIASMVMTPSQAPDTAPRALLDWLRDGRGIVARLSDAGTRADAASRLALDSRRIEAMNWTAEREPSELPQLFLTTEIAALGRPAGIPMPDGWGTAQTAGSGCLCRAFPDPPAPHRVESRGGTGLLATSIDDLELRVLESLRDLGLPFSLVRGVMAAATQDLLDAARPAYFGDWLSLAGQVRDLPQERIIDYISALTAGGPLVPAGVPTTDSNGPR
jgi:hypothetical protein